MDKRAQVRWRRWWRRWRYRIVGLHSDDKLARFAEQLLATCDDEQIELVINRLQQGLRERRYWRRHAKDREGNAPKGEPPC